jgi:hypothetical protein
MLSLPDPLPTLIVQLITHSPEGHLKLPEYARMWVQFNLVCKEWANFINVSWEATKMLLEKWDEDTTILVSPNDLLLCGNYKLPNESIVTSLPDRTFTSSQITCFEESHESIDSGWETKELKYEDCKGTWRRGDQPFSLLVEATKTVCVGTDFMYDEGSVVESKDKRVASVTQETFTLPLRDSKRYWTWFSEHEPKHYALLRENPKGYYEGKLVYDLFEAIKGRNVDKVADLLPKMRNLVNTSLNDPRSAAFLPEPYTTVIPYFYVSELQNPEEGVMLGEKEGEANKLEKIKGMLLSYGGNNFKWKIVTGDEDNTSLRIPYEFHMWARYSSDCGRKASARSEEPLRTDCSYTLEVKVDWGQMSIGFQEIGKKPVLVPLKATGLTLQKLTLRVSRSDNVAMIAEHQLPFTPGKDLHLFVEGCSDDKYGGCQCSVVDILLDRFL